MSTVATVAELTDASYLKLRHASHYVRHAQTLLIFSSLSSAGRDTLHAHNIPRPPWSMNTLTS